MALQEQRTPRRQDELMWATDGDSCGVRQDGGFSVREVVFEFSSGRRGQISQLSPDLDARPHRAEPKADRDGGQFTLASHERPRARRGAVEGDQVLPGELSCLTHAGVQLPVERCQRPRLLCTHLTSRLNVIGNSQSRTEYRKGEHRGRPEQQPQRDGYDNRGHGHDNRERHSSRFGEWRGEVQLPIVQLETE